MLEKLTATVYSFLCLCASFLIIKGVPEKYYAALILILLLDGIFTFLINAQLKKRPFQTTIPKILDTGLFLIFLAIGFNIVCLLEERITTFGFSVVFIIILAYIAYIFKTGFQYFATTSIPKELLGAGKWVWKLFKAFKDIKDDK